MTLNDADDAMRLVQVREFLGGHSWFDLHMVRLQPPLGYDPHWSRLIDAGLAGLFTLFHHFADAAFAERLMRAIWPLLWLLPVIGGAAAIAWRMAGREAAIVVLLFAVTGLPAMLQFKPGRIDHHNVQTAIAVLAVAATAWSDRLRWTATAAGILTGLGLAIGFECMPLLVLCGAVMTPRHPRPRGRWFDARLRIFAGRQHDQAPSSSMSARIIGHEPRATASPSILRPRRPSAGSDWP